MLIGTVIVQRQGPVALLRMNRPEKRNALNRAMGGRLARLLTELDADPDTRVIVLTGSEGAFCAGADMGETLDSGEPSGAGRAVAGAMRVRKPLLAAVNGYAYGGGALLATVCDLRIGSPAARFRFVGTSYGLVVGAAHLTRVVGAPWAKELIFTARVVEAAEAVEMGLLNRLVPEGSLLDETLTLAFAIAENSAAAVEAAKAVIEQAASVEAALALEAEANRRLRGSEEQRERFRQAARRVARATPQAPNP